jgi:hypothetical protein
MEENKVIKNNELVLSEVIVKFTSEKSDDILVYNSKFNISERFSSEKKVLFDLSKSKVYFLSPSFGSFFGSMIQGGLTGALVSGAATGTIIGGPIGTVIGAIGGLGFGYFKSKSKQSNELSNFDDTIKKFLKNKKKVDKKNVFITTKLLYDENSLDLIKLIIDSGILDSIVFIPRNFYPASDPFVLLSLSHDKANKGVSILDLTEYSNNDPYLFELPKKIDLKTSSYSYTTTYKKIISSDYLISRKKYGDNNILGKKIFHFSGSDTKPVVFNSNFNENYMSFIYEIARIDFKKDVAKKIDVKTSLFRKYILNYPVEKLSLNEQCDYISSKYYELLETNKELKSKNVNLKNIKKDLIFLVGTFDHSIKGVLTELISSSNRLLGIIEDNPEIGRLKKKKKFAKQDLQTVSTTISTKVERLKSDIKNSVDNIKNIENHVKEKVDLTSFIEDYKEVDGRFDYKFAKEYVKDDKLFVKVNKTEFQEIIENLIDNSFEHAFSSKEKNLLKMSLIENDEIVFSISNSGKKFSMTQEEFFTFGSSSKEGDFGKGGALIKRHLDKNNIELKIVHLDDDYKTRIDLYFKKIIE